jgi:hypothetical protein
MAVAMLLDHSAVMLAASALVLVQSGSHYFLEVLFAYAVHIQHPTCVTSYTTAHSFSRFCSTERATYCYCSNGKHWQ